MAIAQWLTKKWEISSSKILGISNLSGGRGLELDTSSSTEGNAQQVIKGYSNRTLKIDFLLVKGISVADVQEEINSWEQLVGKTAPLYIAGKRYLAEKYLLKSCNYSDLMLANDGTIIQAKISLDFEEYGKNTNSTKASASTSSTSSTSSSSKLSIDVEAVLSAAKASTAASVRASKEDKTEKKGVC